MNNIYIGDCMGVLSDLVAEGVKVQCCVTSPPYWGLRDYGVDGQLGLERTPEEYVTKMVEVFRAVWEVLAEDGTVFLNLGDSYFGGGRGGGGSFDSERPGWRAIPCDQGGVCPLCMHSSAPYVPPTASLKPKDLVGIPWRVAFALQADGWYLRSDIIWHKPNPMPESVTDRPTKAHEYLFLLSKSERYYYDHDAIKEPAIYFDGDRKGRALDAHKSAPTEKHNGIRPVYKNARSYDGKHSDKQRGHGRRHAGFNERWDAMSKVEQCRAMRNKRSVWTIPTKPYSGAHFATFPPGLIKPCILAGSRPGDIVLDPFGGSGTTGEVAEGLGRKWILIELNEAYRPLIEKRTAQMGLGL